jgi:leucyl-tRNA synthetase
MKQSGYPHSEIESKWQKAWEHVKLDITSIDSAKKSFGSAQDKPFYNLMMFPYPSAEGLHVGNMYAFTGSDIFGRFKRMQGYDVFEPIGLDGFGIHSENYALKIGRHPMDHAKTTEKRFYAQLATIGAMFDWTRTVETYDIDYYRWTQWLFVQMFKHGLAYRDSASVNYCPSCKTVLADEQVINGKCERCGNTVEKRLLEQWFCKITAYAEKLLENSFSLDWSEKVKVAQQNWIGKKEGINITYPVVDKKNTTVGEVTCFTTRPDTNFGATFVVMAPDHPLVSQLLTVIESARRVQVTKYVKATRKKSEADRIAEGRKKTGVATGLFCVNQLNGYTMPLYISDFVLASFGTGAVVGVPAHDLRDFEFATSFKIPIIRVVKGADGDVSPVTRKEQVQEDEGVMVNSDFLNGMDIHNATEKIMDHLMKKGWGKREVIYHLRDWLISRQRYWGPPIPMIHCDACEKIGEGERPDMPGWWTVPVSQLPVVLPRIADYKPGTDGIAPLAKHKEFYETKCPGCGMVATRETDVSDTFLDSSWYFLRYPSVFRDGDKSSLLRGPRKAGVARSSDLADRENLPWNPAITKKWLPVNMYTGGAEHSVLHLMYSRFVTMALKDWGYINFEEPFTKFYAHGLVIKDGAKMSKSKGNIVNPDQYIALYGADALRMYLMFMGPFDLGGDFRDAAMEGMSRWANRVWRLGISNVKTQISNEKIKNTLQKLIKKVTEDTEKRRYNTALASMMEWTNLIADEGGKVSKEDFITFLLILAPYAPYMTEELYQQLRSQIANRKSQIVGFKAEDSIHVQKWPEYDLTGVKDEAITFVLQVNGKLRDTISVSVDQSKKQKEIETLAGASENFKRHVADKKIIKTIFVPGKLINFVV